MTNNFINSVEFVEDFPPFKWGDEIYFWGETEVQNLIKFYLKDKTILDSKWKKISAKDNAERFKINCVLGNNWGGKSRLLNELFYICNNYSTINGWDKNKVIRSIFDNFDKLSINRFFIYWQG